MTKSSDPREGNQADSHPLDRAELVHEARKAIKRMRALARLLRHELGEQEFKRVNKSLRIAGCRLAGARDAEVLVATLERLRDRHPKALALDGIGSLAERLQNEREQANGRSYEHEVLLDIAEMRRDLTRWNLASQDFEAVAPGLRRLYREGRRRYRRVKHGHGCDEEDVHDWRKRVKSLYYALDMLGGKKAKGARRSTKRADRLGELLGDEHDLWMLCSYLLEHPHAAGEDPSAHRKLLKLIERRRKRLRKRALKLGGRLYKRKAGGFTRRVDDALGD